MTTGKKINKKLSMKLVTVNLDTLAEVDACSHVNKLLEIATTTRQVCDTGKFHSHEFSAVGEILNDTIQKLELVKARWESNNKMTIEEVVKRIRNDKNVKTN